MVAVRMQGCARFLGLQEFQFLWLEHSLLEGAVGGCRKGVQGREKKICGCRFEVYGLNLLALEWVEGRRSGTDAIVWFEALPCGPLRALSA